MPKRLLIAVSLVLALAAPGQGAEGGGAPFDGDLQRLAEILGSLHYLRGLCGANEGTKWRDQMQALSGLWAQQFGTPNWASHGGFCSVNMAVAGLYSIGYSFWEFGAPDWDQAKYFMLWGVAEDHSSNPIKIGLDKLKRRGARFVSVNPVRTGYSAIADEWVPIRPGTDGLLALASISAAIGYAEGGRLARTLGGWQVISWALIIAVPFILVPTVLAVDARLATASAAAWACFAYVGVVSMFLGFFAWYRGLALGGIAAVGQVQLLQPFLTIFASALLLGEVIEPWCCPFQVSIG